MCANTTVVYPCVIPNIFAQTYLWILLLLLYSPIVIIVIYSFTEAKVLGNWTGFSTKLYSSLFTTGAHHSLMNALINTITIALLAATAYPCVIPNETNKRKREIPVIISPFRIGMLFTKPIAFCTPYVVLSVLPRLKQMNPNIYEAALDLGATPMQKEKRNTGYNITIQNRYVIHKTNRLS